MVIWFGLVLGFVFLCWFIFFRENWKTPHQAFPKPWRIILIEEVDFYNHLNKEQKDIFEFKIQEFLLNCRIIGVSTTVDERDRLLIASSAVIPVFAFPQWRYTHLNEVLLYPTTFNEDGQVSGDDRSILGMVGTGNFSGMMLLSKQALYQGFSNDKDSNHTAIHEFAHVVDKVDGVIDGVPSSLMPQRYVGLWLKLIQKEMKKIKANDSDVRAYGATNQAEFFSVICESFFENPHKLQSKHPRICKILEKTFKQKRTLWSRYVLKRKIGRNSLCPCGSGRKFKHCCG